MQVLLVVISPTDIFFAMQETSFFAFRLTPFHSLMPDLAVNWDQNSGLNGSDNFQ